MRSNRDKLDALAQLLLDKEVIFKENVKEIFGPRPWDKEDEVEPENTTEGPSATDQPEEDAPIEE